MLNNEVCSIAVMPDDQSIQQEAEALAILFRDVPNKAAFAREFKVPGGPSMISQHLSGHRPMNIAAATAYARGFGVPISRISKRLATLVQGAQDVATTSEVTGHNNEDERLLGALKDWRLQASTRSQAVIDRLCVLAQKNALREEDWQLIEQLVERLRPPSKK